MAIGNWVCIRMRLKSWRRVDPPQWNDRQVLACRLAIHMDLGDWAVIVDISRELALRNPKEPEWWINWAFGAWRLESLSAAEVILHEALEALPNEPCIHFNLGCYACVQGRLAEAKDRLLRAIKLAPSLRKSALEDEDLTVLRDWLRRSG
jgi:Flp pilus assembly protein TadD